MEKKKCIGKIWILVMAMYFSVLSGCGQSDMADHVLKEPEVTGGTNGAQGEETGGSQDEGTDGAQGEETGGSQDEEANGAWGEGTDDAQGEEISGSQGETDGAQGEVADDSQEDGTNGAQGGETDEPQERGIFAASDRDAVKQELMESMQQLRQPRVLDISLLGMESPELDIKNIYYSITAEHPELKYAYDLTIAVDGAEAKCQFYYMPYKTGIFEEGFVGEEAGSIAELLAVAESHLGEISVPVRITNPQLEPDRINRALNQVGGGYILCALNIDATALQYSAPLGMTMEDCIAALDLADDMADEVIAKVITADMTEREQAEALYSYLTQTVSYDQQYYADRDHMSYDSQTAVGALHDHVAICGGYANALQLLYKKIGIPCYQVSGRYFDEYHMWNLAKLDGEWLWFDATIDRGSSSEYGFLRFALAELDDVKYHYREQDVLTLMDSFGGKTGTEM